MCNDPSDIPDEFKTWAKIGDLSETSDDLNIEVLEDLKPWVDSGQVQVEWDNQKYFDLLEAKYPIALNRIDWRGFRGYCAFDVLPISKEAMAGNKHEEKLAACRDLLRDWFNSSGVSFQERVVWIGDVSNICLHMTIETLLGVYPLLFSWPQHSYVLPLTGQWCLNYAMEGQLFFGKAGNVIAHGCVNLDESL